MVQVSTPGLGWVNFQPGCCGALGATPSGRGCTRKTFGEEYWDLDRSAARAAWIEVIDPLRRPVTASQFPHRHVQGAAYRAADRLIRVGFDLGRPPQARGPIGPIHKRRPPPRTDSPLTKPTFLPRN